MGVTQYIGARYVPLFADPAEWTKTRSYEPLTIVLHEGNSFTSRQFVPVGIELTNENFWLETGNYNAQVEAYRQEVIQYTGLIQDNLGKVNTLYNGAKYMPEMFGAVGDGVTDDSKAIQAAIDAAYADGSHNQVIFTAQNYLIKKTLNVPGRMLFSSNNVQEFTPQILADFQGTMFNCTSAGVCFSNLIFRPTETNYWNVDAVRIIPGGNDVDSWVRFCKFFFMHTAYETWGRSVVFENNNFSNTTNSIVVHDLENARDTARSYIIVGNRFHSWGRDNETEANGHGIYFDFNYSNEVNEVFIANNYIDRSQSDGSFIYGQWVTGYITNNQYNLNAGMFVEMDSTLHDSHPSQILIISNNDISLRTTARRSYGIYLTDGVNTVITNNTFTNCLEALVYLDGGSRINITNNTTNTTTDYSPKEFVELEGSRRVIIANNCAVAAQSSARYLQYHAKGNTTYTDNYVYGNQAYAYAIANFPYRTRDNNASASNEATLPTQIARGESVDFFAITPRCIICKLPGNKTLPFYRFDSSENYYASPVFQSLELAYGGQINISDNQLTNTHVYSFNPTTNTIINDAIAIQGYTVVN